MASISGLIFFLPYFAPHLCNSCIKTAAWVGRDGLLKIFLLFRLIPFFASRLRSVGGWENRHVRCATHPAVHDACGPLTAGPGSLYPSDIFFFDYCGSGARQLGVFEWAGTLVRKPWIKGVFDCA
ncbi:hypothetical protein HBI25_180640 [Parastagonospora nodorum]|nr:hypothetical protein HBH51_170010 [Parastagonospora nodorum]KAH4035396.1 hypothetical protein HBI09_099100 [Parastagonospora nodorum]KAH4048604.1 hypothetical protein HBH49_148930 [Parastagonospora nodorum]KAH4085383.1 hypothetical protein HBH46_209430 [Parastagonospora nodorum]KAH4172698.1 hypothetical protein HBH43_093340 [Parastagonospora nodorum]